MLTVSRRGLFAIGGTGAAAVLAGCGSATDERDDADDQALLSSAVQAEMDLQSAYDNLGGGVVAGRAGADVVNRCREDSSKRQSELGRLNAALPPDGSGSSATSANNGFDSAQTAANAAIAAYRNCARLLGAEDQRAVCTGFLAQVAAELASFRGLFGEDQAPVAFVTGGAEKPFQAAATTTTSTTSSTTSTTSTSTDAQ
jgi:hypothetical protein